MTADRIRVRVRTDSIAYDGDPDGRRLTVQFSTRPAHRFESVAVAETPDEVVVELVVTSPRGPTRASGVLRRVRVELAAPLGERRVVDRASGRTLPRGIL
jgi:hypothetical protein